MQHRFLFGFRLCTRCQLWAASPSLTVAPFFDWSQGRMLCVIHCFWWWYFPLFINMVENQQKCSLISKISKSRVEEIKLLRKRNNFLLQLCALPFCIDFQSKTTAAANFVFWTACTPNAAATIAEFECSASATTAMPPMLWCRPVWLG